MRKLTELEIKRQNAKKALPEVKALIKKHGYETLNYVWQKVIQAEREVNKAEVEAKAAQARVDKLKRQLKEEV